MTGVVVRLAVAVLVAAAVGLGVPAPAQAATCSTAHGVSVVVDFHQLGGGVRMRCDGGGAGEVAWDQLDDVGFDLTAVRQEAFVCRIDGKPSADQESCERTPPSDAYWSLWWSDGKSDRWAFAAQGAGSLRVPEGGSVAMSWQSGNGQVPPGAPAPTHKPQPTSTPQPSSGPSQPPPSSASVAPPTSGPTTSPSAAPTTDRRADTGRHDKGKPSKKPKAHDQRSDGSDGTHAVGPAADVSEASGGSSSGGLPGWVAPVAIVVLFAGIGTIALFRRKSSGGA